MAYLHECFRRDAQFSSMKSTFHYSESKLQMKFDVSFHQIILHYIILQRDYSTAQYAGITAPRRENFQVNFAGDELPAAISESSLTWHHVRDRVGEGIGESTGNRLPDDQMKKFLDLVEKEVCDLFKTTGAVLPRCGVVSFECAIVTGFQHVYNYDGGGGRIGMVPAAESSFELLEICKDDEEGCCSICLDELSGGGGGVALRMPCLHVFHGWCIQEWLRKSHYCPLCRYEMPVQE